MACSPPAGESPAFVSPNHSAEIKRATFHSKRPVATPHAGQSGKEPTGAPNTHQVSESEHVEAKEKVGGKDAKTLEDNAPGKTPKGPEEQDVAFTPSDQEARFWVVGWDGQTIIVRTYDN